MSNYNKTPSPEELANINCSNVNQVRKDFGSQRSLLTTTDGLVVYMAGHGKHNDREPFDILLPLYSSYNKGTGCLLIMSQCGEFAKVIHYNPNNVDALAMDTLLSEFIEWERARWHGLLNVLPSDVDPIKKAVYAWSKTSRGGRKIAHLMGTVNVEPPTTDTVSSEMVVPVRTTPVRNRPEIGEWIELPSGDLVADVTAYGATWMIASSPNRTLWVLCHALPSELKTMISKGLNIFNRRNFTGATFITDDSGIGDRTDIALRVIKESGFFRD